MTVFVIALLLWMLATIVVAYLLGFWNGKRFADRQRQQHMSLTKTDALS